MEKNHSTHSQMNRLSFMRLYMCLLMIVSFVWFGLSFLFCRPLMSIRLDLPDADGGGANRVVRVR